MANGVMQIKYSEERIASKASRACNELEDICSSLSKVRKKLNGLPERSRSGENLSSASSFLKKKQQQYERRQDALETLQKRSNTFMSHVETTEKKLSSQIKKEYKQFHKQTGIGKTRGAVILDSLVKAGKVAFNFFTYLIPGYGTVKLVKDLWTAGTKIVDAIKNWYNNLPEGVRFALEAIGAVVVAVVAIVAFVTAIGAAAAAIGTAVAAFGCAALSTASVVTACGSAFFATASAVGATISMVNSVITACKDVGEAGLYFSGNKASARELNSKTVAEMLGDKLGFSPELYNNIVNFGAVCSLIGGIGSFGLKVQQGVVNPGTRISSFKDGVKAYGNSFKTELGKQLKDLTGFDDFKGLKTYVKENSLKSVFTAPISLKDASQMNAFKGLKAFGDWVTLSPISDIGKIISPDKSSSRLWEILTFVF